MRSGLEGVAPAFGGRRFDWQPFVKGLGHFGFNNDRDSLPANASHIVQNYSPARPAGTDACVGQKI